MGVLYAHMRVCGLYMAICACACVVQCDGTVRTYVCVCTVRVGTVCTYACMCVLCMVLYEGICQPVPLRYVARGVYCGGLPYFCCGWTVAVNSLVMYEEVHLLCIVADEWVYVSCVLGVCGKVCIGNCLPYFCCG